MGTQSLAHLGERHECKQSNFSFLCKLARNLGGAKRRIANRGSARISRRSTFLFCANWREILGVLSGASLTEALRGSPDRKTVLRIEEVFASSKRILLGSSSTASRVSRPGCRTSGHPERKLCILLQEFLSRFLGKYSLHCATWHLASVSIQTHQGHWNFLPGI